MTDQTNPTPEQDESNPRNPFETFLYHQRRALEETGKALESLLPEGFREHGVNATREFSKGLRVLMEAAIEEVKKASDKMKQDGTPEASTDGDDASTTGASKVKVVVE
jgi:hypothetical protein